MQLGDHTFIRLPGNMTPIEKEKKSAIKDTYSDVAFFSWPPSLVGLRVRLSWKKMEQSEYDVVLALYEADTEVPFDPEDYLGSGSGTYNVEVVRFRGSYVPAFPTRRYNCDLELLIMSVV